MSSSPPKGTSSKSVFEYENKARRSIDNKSTKKQEKQKSHRKNPSDLEKTEKNSFENRIKKFMDKSDVDRELEEKVKLRLK